MMLCDIFCFNKQVIVDFIVGKLEGQMLGGYFECECYFKGFINDYLLVMGVVIWFMLINEMCDYLVESFVFFFDNYCLLFFDCQFWCMVFGGSCNYVECLIVLFFKNICFGCLVVEILWENSWVMVKDLFGNMDIFDYVIVVSYIDQSFLMLGDVSD